jgi:Ca2+-binding RTX toxin-like protein
MTGRTGGVALLVASLLALPVDGGDAAQSAGWLAPKCKGRQVTILGTEDADVIRGSNRRDVILALGGGDRVEGRGGNDVICGGAGRDLLDGGPGHDKIFGGADGRSEQRNDDGVRLMVGDVVQGGPGDDLIDLGFDERQQTFGSTQRDRLSYKGSAFRVVVTLGTPKGRGHARGDGRDVLVEHPFLALLGSDRGDLLTGSTYGDQILGRGGADQIDGLGGRDVLVDGPVRARSGDDVLVGGIGRDQLTTHGGHDELDGGFSADALTAERVPIGRLSLVGGRGSDVLTVGGMLAGSCVQARGGAGRDTLVPAVSRQIRKGKVDADLRSGAFGPRGRGGDGCGRVVAVETLTIDNPFGSAQRLRWFVRGTSVAETVVLRRGGSVLATMAGGPDRVVGSTGDDNLKGGSGHDRLFGGEGKDVAVGGPGNDTCRQVEFRRGCEIPAG